MSGLQEFKDVLADFKSITSYAVTGTIAAPLADFALNLGPPSPAGVQLLTSVVELVTLISVFHFWFGASQKRLKRRITALLIVLCLSFFGYMILSGYVTFTNPSDSKRYAKGLVVRADVRELIPEPFKDADDALQNYEYEPSRIWETWSITAANVLLLVNWIVLFASLSAFIGTFVISQRHRTVNVESTDDAHSTPSSRSVTNRADSPR